MKMHESTTRAGGRPSTRGPTLLLGVRIPPEIHRAWRLAAEEDGRTIVEATIEALADALRQRELRKQAAA
jgi:hypothetical protein